MSTKRHLLTLLRSSDVQRIRLSLTVSSNAQISVNGSSFAQVADAISAGKIHIVERNSPGGGQASYSAWANPSQGVAANTLCIGSGPRWSRAFDALLVHESVHAAFDINRFHLTWLDNESVAYIAQGCYLRNSGFPSDRLIRVGQGNHVYLGRQVAAAMVNGSIDAFWLKELQQSLQTSPLYGSYIGGTFTGDG